jgi:hypothetical protein
MCGLVQHVPRFIAMVVQARHNAWAQTYPQTGNAVPLVRKSALHSPLACFSNGFFTVLIARSKMRSRLDERMRVD